MAFTPLLETPTPDFDELVRVLEGSQTPRRVHLIELSIDDDVLAAISERYLGRPWIPLATSWLHAPPPASYLQQVVTLFYRLGYDLIPKITPTAPGLPPFRRQESHDPGVLARGPRAWADRQRGLIASWAEFASFPWPRIRLVCPAAETLAPLLPAGMKMALTTQLFGHVTENLLGGAAFYYLLHDAPDLVAAVFEQWGQRVFDFYRSAIGEPEVGAIFHGDDLGHKTSTLVSPGVLRQFVFPWLKRYADLAHEHGKPFWLHCCGNVYNGVMESLINEIGIDAMHSFQDVILPVSQFKARYGQRVATLGGVDMDNLARLDERELRATIREVLTCCMPGGRFALGSGNGVTSFVPLENYFVMLDEARRW